MAVNRIYRIVAAIISGLLRRFGMGNFPFNRRLDTSKWHLDFIVHLVTILKPEKYLEIGVYRAGLINRLTHLIPEIVAVDIDPRAKSYIESLKNVEFINMDSKDFWKTRSGGEFDLIFIDGNHSRDAVLVDFEGARNCIKDHGVILLHDTYPLDREATNPERCDNGYLAIQELSFQTQEFEMMTIPVHPGLTIVRKRTTQVPWSEN